MGVYKAIAAVAADMAEQGIGKTRTNEQQHYKYRGIDEVMNALAPSLAKHGLMILPRVVARTVTERPTRDKLGTLFYVIVESEFDFVASGDGSKHTCKTFGEAMDTGDKATNKAMSAAFKYAAFQSFCIPTEGDGDADADTQTHEPKPHNTGAGRTSEPTSGSQPSPTAGSYPGPAPAPGIPPVCPKCGGPMYDNRKRRADAERAGKKPGPAWACTAGKYDAATRKRSGCDGVIWPSDPAEVAQPKKAETSPQAATGGIAKITELRTHLDLIEWNDYAAFLDAHNITRNDWKGAAALAALEAAALSHDVGRQFEAEMNAKPMPVCAYCKSPETKLLDAATHTYFCSACNRDFIED